MSHTIEKRNIATLISSLLLLIIAFLHKGQLNVGSSSAYTNSIYIPLEMILMTITGILILTAVFFVIADLLKKNWRKLLFTGAVLLISIIFLVIAMIVDAPTLLYIT